MYKSILTSCSLNSPNRVKSGTSTAPPPIPAAEANTVARFTPMAVFTSPGPNGKRPSLTGISGWGRYRVKHLALQWRWLAHVGSHSSHVVEHSGYGMQLGVGWG